MNLSLKLILFRKYKNWKQAEVAKRLGVSPEYYKYLEKGQTKANDILVQKLSDLYRVPAEIFLTDNTPRYFQAEVLYANCRFTNDTGGTGGYINHQYNDKGIDEIMFLRKEEIKKLELQIMELQKQNSKLVEILGERVKEII